MSTSGGPPLVKIAVAYGTLPTALLMAARISLNRQLHETNHESCHTATCSTPECSRNSMVSELGFVRLTVHHKLPIFIGRRDSVRVSGLKYHSENPLMYSL